MSWLTTVDHKRIGFLYGIFALFFFLVGGFEALLIRPSSRCRTTIS
jgi:cytochrome c oxidase subunit 1